MKEKNFICRQIFIELLLCRRRIFAVVVAAAAIHRLINSYFTEISIGVSSLLGGGRGGATLSIVSVAVIEVSLNLGGQAHLKSTHSLFEKVSLATNNSWLE